MPTCTHADARSCMHECMHLRRTIMKTAAQSMCSAKHRAFNGHEKSGRFNEAGKYCTENLKVTSPSAGHVWATLDVSNQALLVAHRSQHVMPDVQDLCALGRHLLRHCGIASAEEDVLPMLLRGRHDLVCCCKGLGSLILVWHAERSGEVVGSEDDAVQAGHAADFVDVLDRLDGLDHHADEDALVGGGQVVGHRNPAIVHRRCGPEASAATVRLLLRAGLRLVVGWAPLPTRGVAAVRHDASDVVRRADLRHCDAVCVAIERVLDEHAPRPTHPVDAVRPRHAHDGGAAFAVGHHHVPLQHLRAHRDVLRVVPDEVRAVCQRIGGGRVRELHADAYQGLALCELLTEVLDGLELHPAAMVLA
mmetsp:Transcript_62336/g.182087  ORF Transcript_62336/g.182087 Transcript_62336/m.182087 type:complete len:363 (+) Transcript_62336:23-1111(+)